MLQNKLENAATQNQVLKRGGNFWFTMHIDTSIKNIISDMGKPDSQADQYYVFKESDTEKLAVSVNMLKQLKGNVASNHYVGKNKKKRHNKKSLVPS